MAYVPNISNTLLNKLLHPTLVLQVCVHVKNAAKLLLQGRGNQRKSVRKHERKLFPICAEKVQNMCKDHLTPCNAGKIPLGLEWLVHGRMAPSRYPRTATCGILEGLRMCIHHHPTIQQLASQNHRKLKFQTATCPVVAELYVSLFTSRRDASESYTELMLNVSGSLSYSSLLHGTLQTISHHKSTNKLTMVTIVHIFRFTKKVWLQISCSWPPTLWLALLRVPWKKRPEPCCQKCHGSCLWHPLTEML